MRKSVYCLGAVIFYLVVQHKYRVLIGKTVFFFFFVVVVVVVVVCLFVFYLGYHIKGIKMLSMLWSKLLDGATWIAIVIYLEIMMITHRAICNSKILPCMKFSYTFHSSR